MSAVTAIPESLYTRMHSNEQLDHAELPMTRATTKYLSTIVQRCPASLTFSKHAHPRIKLNQAKSNQIKVLRHPVLPPLLDISTLASPLFPFDLTPR